MASEKMKVLSGISRLDHLLGGGPFIGDNVVWYDEVGSQAPVFWLNFVHSKSLAPAKRFE